MIYLFGPEYLIQNHFDPRLIVKIAPAVAKAAMDSGVATRPITDWDAYRAKLSEFVYHTGTGMRAIFQQLAKPKVIGLSLPRVKKSVSYVLPK